MAHSATVEPRAEPHYSHGDPRLADRRPGRPHRHAGRRPRRRGVNRATAACVCMNGTSRHGRIDHGDTECTRRHGEWRNRAYRILHSCISSLPSCLSSPCSSVSPCEILCLNPCRDKSTSTASSSRKKTPRSASTTTAAVRRRRVRRPAQLRRQGLPPRRAPRAAVRIGQGDLARDPDVARGRWPRRSTRPFAVNEHRATATSALVVTRGAGTLGLDPNRCSNPQVIIIADAISLYPQELYEKGLEIVTVERAAQSSGGAQPADQVAQLPQQHPGQDRRPAGRLHRSPDAQPQGRSRRVHGRQHLPGPQRRAAARRRSTPAFWKASRATR